MKKIRKRRGIKQNGDRSLDLCPGCFSFHCDPATMSRKFKAKIDRRRALGLCPACGANPCKCKSKLTDFPRANKEDRMRIGLFKAKIRREINRNYP